MLGRGEGDTGQGGHSEVPEAGGGGQQHHSCRPTKDSLHQAASSFPCVTQTMLKFAKILNRTCVLL